MRNPTRRLIGASVLTVILAACGGGDDPIAVDSDDTVALTGNSSDCLNSDFYDSVTRLELATRTTSAGSTSTMNLILDTTPNVTVDGKTGTLYESSATGTLANGDTNSMETQSFVT